MAQVVLENVRKTYPGGVTAVENLNLTIHDREFVVFVGPSGCGKSTILRLVAGLEELTGGRISLDGQCINDLPPKDRDLAMVFQNYALYPHMTAYQNMAFGLRLRKISRNEIDQRVHAAAQLLGLTAAQLQRKPKSLSGGQRQRVAVGRAIVRQPQAFLFDEPLSNLDAQMRVQMRTEISQLHHRLQTTMLYVTHDQMEAMTLGDRIVVLNNGRLQQADEPATLYDHPQNLFVAGFIGSPAMNFIRGTIDRRPPALWFVTTTGFALRLPESLTAKLTGYIGKPVVLGARPEHITPSAPSGQTVDTTIEVIEPLGAESYLLLTTGAHNFTMRVNAGHKFAVNQRLTVAFNAAHCHVFDSATEQAVA